MTASRQDLPQTLQVLAALRVRARQALHGGRLSEARAHAEQVLAYQEAHAPDDQAGLIRSLEILRDVDLAAGRLDAARRTARRIEDYATGLGELEAARAAHGLGVTSARIGDAATARREFQSARETVEGFPDRADPEARELHAAVLAGLAAVSDGAAADEMFEAALALRLSLSGEEDLQAAQILSAWALHRSQAGDDVEALRLSERALEARRRTIAYPHPDIARSLIETGWLYARLGELSKGAGLVLEALAALTEGEAPSVEARALFLMAAILAEAGATATALLFNKASVQILQRLRRATVIHEPAFLAARGDVYRRLAADLLSAGRWPEAQAALRLLKASDHSLEGAGLQLPFSAAEGRLWDALRAQIRQARAEMLAGGDARAPLAQATAQLASLEDALSGAGRAQSRPAQAARERPEAGVARLQYLLSSDRVRILVTTRLGMRGVEVAFSTEELQREVLALRVEIGRRSPDWAAHARAIHDRLIQPIAEDLEAAEVKRLEVSLDGVLRHLPMAALYDGEACLLERFAIVVEVGAEPPRCPHRGAAPRAAAFGVSRAIGQHSALGGVRDEICAVVGGEDGRRGALPGIVHLDEAFTAVSLQAALAEGYEVIHVASHFVLAPAQEGASYLLLGDGQTLPLADFARLSFEGVELLTLSACDTATGGGRWDDGREFEGMAALALAAGAQAVVATHWPIRDRTSARLMEAFYRGRYHQDLALEEALRRAQLELLQDPSDASGRERGLTDPDAPAGGARPGNKHPYYWAPYVLMR